jgi:hypothetical protein
LTEESTSIAIPKASLESINDDTLMHSIATMDSPFFFLFVLLLSCSADSDVFAFQNSHIFASRAAAAPGRHSKIRSTTGGTVLLLNRGEINGCISDEYENNNERTHQNDAELFLLEYSIDSFLRGDYDRTFAENAASPLPGLSPSDTIDAALRSLRDLDEPEPFHGAAVFLCFCVELGRGERWGTTGQGISSSSSTWKELLRGTLTPTMLARRLRASEEFSGLLDWTGLEITEDDYGNAGKKGGRDTTVFRDDNVACVDAALSFENDETIESTSPPEVYQFELAKMLGGVWLIDSVQQKRSSGLLRQQQQPPPPRPARKPLGSQEGRSPPRPQQHRGKPRRQRKQGKRKLDDDDGNKTSKREPK